MTNQTHTTSADLPTAAEIEAFIQELERCGHKELAIIDDDGAVRGWVSEMEKRRLPMDAHKAIIAFWARWTDQEAVRPVIMDHLRATGRVYTVDPVDHPVLGRLPAQGGHDDRKF
jgi:hypothetical protein